MWLWAGSFLRRIMTSCIKPERSVYSGLDTVVTDSANKVLNVLEQAEMISDDPQFYVQGCAGRRPAGARKNHYAD